MALSKQYKNRKEEIKKEYVVEDAKDVDKVHEINRRSLDALEHHHKEREKIHEKLVDLYLSVKVRPAD